MSNVHDILKAWDENQHCDWYAIDMLKADGSMMRVSVGTYQEARTRLDNMVFNAVDYCGTPVAPGEMADEPFYRVVLLAPDAARVFFEACADANPPEDAATMYTITAAAKKLGRTRQAVQELVKRGRLNAELVLGEWRIMGYEMHQFTPYRYN